MGARLVPGRVGDGPTPGVSVAAKCAGERVCWAAARATPPSVRAKLAAPAINRSTICFFLDLVLLQRLNPDMTVKPTCSGLLLDPPSEILKALPDHMAAARRRGNIVDIPEYASSRVRQQISNRPALGWARLEPAATSGSTVEEWMIIPSRGGESAKSRLERA